MVEFPSIDYEAWKAAVSRELGGTDPESALARDLLDGLWAKPLYTRADELPHRPFRSPPRPAVTAVCSHPEPDRALEQLRADLRGGAEAIWLRVHRPHRRLRAPRHPPGGLRAFTRDWVADAFRGLDAPPRALILEAGWDPGGALRELRTGLDGAGVDPGAVAIHIGQDPLGALVTDGALSCPLDAAWDRLVRWIEESDEAPAQSFALVTALPYLEAGAGPATALGCALSAAVSTLRALEERGVPAERAARRIGFSLPVTCHIFTSVAALRALRVAFARVLGACGVRDEPRLVHACTSPVMLARLDVMNNALRNANAAVAATLGGADLLTVLPHDGAMRPGSPEAARLARLTGWILCEEARLHEVQDPLAGSWYVERLTDAMARRAYEVFQDIEREGGLDRAARSGALWEQIRQCLIDKRMVLMARRATIVGVNRYAVADEDPLPTEGVIRTSQAGDREEDDAEPRLADDGVEPLPYLPDAELYEAVREMTVRFGKRPRVALIALGTSQGCRERIDFVRDYLASGGIEVEIGEPSEDPRVAAKAWRSDCRAAVICPSADRDEKSILRLLLALRRRTNAPIYLAGTYEEYGLEPGVPGIEGEIHDQDFAFLKLFLLQFPREGDAP